MAGIKRNLFFNFLLSLSQILIPLVSIPYIARVLDPEGIGKVGFIDTFTYYFIVLAEVGIMVYGIREVARLRDDANALQKLVGELLALHLRSTVLSVLLYSVGVWMVWDKIEDLRLIYFSVAFLAINAGACEWYFIGRERFSFIAMRSLFIRIAGLAAIFILLKQPEDYPLYYAIITCSAIATTLWNLWKLYGETHFSLQGAEWKKHLGKVSVTYGISLLYSITLYIDHVLLRMVSTAAAVGFYTFSIKLLRISTSVIGDSMLVFFPRISSLHAGDEQAALQHRLRQNLQLILLLAIPMGMGLFILADDITIVFFGADYMSIGRNLKMLALFPLMRSYSLFLSNSVLMTHQYEKHFLKNLVVSSSLFIVAGLIAGYYLADWGMCAALLFADMVLIILNYRSAKILLPATTLFIPSSFFQALLASATFLPVIWGISGLISLPLHRMWVSVVVSVPIYFAVLVYLFKNSDIEVLLKNGKQTLLSKIQRSIKP